MAQKIKEREYIFRPRPRRTRPALAIMMLGVMSLAAAGVTGGSADEPAAALIPAETQTPDEREALVYGAVGGPERFVLKTDGEDASIRFLCLPSEEECTESMPAPLRAEAKDGETVLSDRAGRPVLTFAARDVRLHAGSAVVPVSVPDKGRAVLPTDARV